MANKNNSRTVRLSDDMLELIDRQVGETFTQRFENLVTRCVWELDAKQKELRSIEKQIDKKKKELSVLNKQAYLYSSRLGEIGKTIDELLRLSSD